MQESKEKNIVCAFVHELAIYSGAKSLLHKTHIPLVMEG